MDINTLAELVYIEYFNNFLTIKRMAEYYNMPEDLLNSIVIYGRKINHETRTEKNA